MFEYEAGVPTAVILPSVPPIMIQVFPHLFIFFIGGVGLSPLGTAATSGLLYRPQMIDEDDCGAIGEMKIGRGNRSSRRKPAPASLCPPQIPHDQTPGRRGWKPATNRLSYGAAFPPFMLQLCRMN
jgi:hypothetical protein